MPNRTLSHASSLSVQLNIEVYCCLWCD